MTRAWRHRALRACTAVAICAALGVPRGADADQAAAAAKVSEANDAYHRGDYRRAAELFEEAHRADPVPALQVNAAQAWRLAGERGRAADAYAAALSVVVGPHALGTKDRAFAERKLDELRKVVATLHVDEPLGATASVGHAQGRQIPLVVHLPPGTYEISARGSAGAALHKRVELRAGEARTVSLAPVGVAPAATDVAPPPGPSTQKASPPADDRPVSAVRVAGWSALATSAVLGGVTAYLGVRTLDAVDRWHASEPRELALHDEAVTLKAATNVTLAAAGVTAAVGLVLLLVPLGDGPAAPSAAISVRARGASVGAKF
jgi:hypothetical protein